MLARRTLLGLLATGHLPLPARAAGRPAYLGCQTRPLEGDGAAGLDAQGETAFALTLPGRGHGFALRPGRAEAVVLARRPGTYAAVFDPASGAVLHRFASPGDRHFFGHGAFTPDGRHLLATENDVASGAGLLGIYDAADRYRRVGEIPSFGIGPHDVQLLPDGRTLAVANGGILTLPGMGDGRRPLNLATMRPSLAYLELESGRLLAERAWEGGLHKLSIRHLAVDRGGRVAAAMQWEGEEEAEVPLLAVDSGAGLRPLPLPPGVAARMRHYAGSVAFDRTGRLVAISCPRGDRIFVLDPESGELVAEAELRDGCGLAPSRIPGRFIATSGMGRVIEIDGQGGAVQELARDRVAWDNHLASLPG